MRINKWDEVSWNLILENTSSSFIFTRVTRKCYDMISKCACPHD